MFVCIKVFGNTKEGDGNQSQGRKKYIHPSSYLVSGKAVGGRKTEKERNLQLLSESLKVKLSPALEAKDVSYSKQVLGISHWSMRGLHTCKNLCEA